MASPTACGLAVLRITVLAAAAAALTYWLGRSDGIWEGLHQSASRYPARSFKRAELAPLAEHAVLVVGFGPLDDRFIFVPDGAWRGGWVWPSALYLFEPTHDLWDRMSRSSPRYVFFPRIARNTARAAHVTTAPGSFRFSLHLEDLAVGISTVITDWTTPQGLAWSPDGSQVAITARRAAVDDPVPWLEGEQGIWIASPEGDAIRVPEAESVVSAPAWACDGSRVFYIVESDTGRKVRSQLPVGEMSMNMDLPVDNATEIAAHPSKTWLVIVRQHGSASGRATLLVWDYLTDSLVAELDSITGVPMWDPGKDRLFVSNMPVPLNSADYTHRGWPMQCVAYDVPDGKATILYDGLAWGTPVVVPAGVLYFVGKNGDLLELIPNANGARIKTHSLPARVVRVGN